MTRDEAKRIICYVLGNNDADRPIDMALAQLVYDMQFEINQLKKRIEDLDRNPGPAHGDLRFGPGGSSTYGQ